MVDHVEVAMKAEIVLTLVLPITVVDRNVPERHLGRVNADVILKALRAIDAPLGAENRCMTPGQQFRVHFRLDADGTLTPVGLLST
jgi:hypothetical protein